MILRPKFPQWRPASTFDLRDGIEFVAPTWVPIDPDRLVDQLEFRTVRLPDYFRPDPRTVASIDAHDDLAVRAHSIKEDPK